MGSIGSPALHFEAPASAQVGYEMERFIQWFNTSQNTLSPLIRAGVAHLCFVSIHPFEDGNGRIGRTLGRPTLIALSLTIEKNKKLYYKALEFNN